MATRTEEVAPTSFRLSNSRARPGRRIVHVMRGRERLATMYLTDTGLRIASSRLLPRPRYSKKEPNAVEIELASSSPES